MMYPVSHRLADVSAQLEGLLKGGALPPPKFGAASIQCRTVTVAMRDGIRLATDVYLPPELPAPVIVVRTPYGRASETSSFAGSLHAYARRGYVVVSQDCRGTGESEPDHWDYYMFEADDSYDCVAWIVQQSWCGDFIGSLGGSYVGQTQWCMATHRRMSAIAPSVSGLGLAANTAHLYMFLNAYAKTVGKGAEKIAVPIHEMERRFEKETMAGGYFNEPLHLPFSSALLAQYPQLRNMSSSEGKRWLWAQYCAMTCAQRADFIRRARETTNVTSVDVEAMLSVFGHPIAHDTLTIPHTSRAELCKMIQAPPLMRTGWYDWGLNDALATWQALRREGRPDVAGRARMIITAYAHNAPGYHVGSDTHPELLVPANALSQVGLLLRWYEAVRDGSTDDWPVVTYYLMGANEWRVASDWPVSQAIPTAFYLDAGSTLVTRSPERNSMPDVFVYDPNDPTPTVGGSIVSYIYRPGSVDVSAVQKRADVLVYTSAPLDRDLDVVGPLRMILYASSTAVDTDFVARLSDVFPDGRAIQLQSGILRARYRHADGEPELLEPGRIYRFEIDLWATANRFKAGHRLRLDISSADFPHYDRNSNRGGEPGDPLPAQQTIYHDAEHPSHLLVSVLPSPTT